MRVVCRHSNGPNHTGYWEEMNKPQNLKTFALRTVAPGTNFLDKFFQSLNQF